MKLIRIINIVYTRNPAGQLTHEKFRQHEFGSVIYILQSLSYRFQMFQNSNKKKLRNISNQIDSQLTKIDRLLTKLGRQKTKTRKITRTNENSPYRFEKSVDSAESHVEEKFNQSAESNDEQTYQYEFTQVSIQKEEEQILLEDYQCNSKSQYLSILRSADALSVKVHTKSNWIQKYLDYGDCEVKLEENSTDIEIIGVQNGMASCFAELYGFFKQEVAQIYKQDFLSIYFTNHLQGISLNTFIQGKSYIYQCQLQNTTRFVLKCQTRNNDMKRILIVKQLTAEEGIRYQLAWGTYFQDSLTQLITLQPGKYIIIPLGITPLAKIQLFFQDLELITFKVASQELLKTRTVLMKTFVQTSSDCYQPSSINIQQEYVRNVYLDIGIVVQTYENIYLYEAKFQDEQQNKQDISLLFSKLYTSQQLENRLKTGQKIVKFYSIQQKPAKLFIPKKYVVMGSKVMQTLKVHSVFK